MTRMHHGENTVQSIDWETDRLIFLTGQTLKLHRSIRAGKNFQQWHHDWVAAWFKFPSVMKSPMAMGYYNNYFKGDQFDAPDEALTMLTSWTEAGFSVEQYLELHEAVNELVAENKLSEIPKETLEWMQLSESGVGYGKGVLRSSVWRDYPTLRQIYSPTKAVLHIIHDRVSS